MPRAVIGLPWFSLSKRDKSTPLSRIGYGRIRFNGKAPWYWKYKTTFSVEIIKKGDNTNLLIEHARKWQQMKSKFNV